MFNELLAIVQGAALVLLLYIGITLVQAVLCFGLGFPLPWPFRRPGDGEPQ